MLKCMSTVLFSSLLALSYPIYAETADSQSTPLIHLAFSAYQHDLLSKQDDESIRELLAPNVIYIDNLKKQKFVGISAVMAHIEKIVHSKQTVIKFGVPKYEGYKGMETDLTTCNCFKKPINITRTIIVNKNGKIIQIEVDAAKKDKEFVIPLEGENSSVE